MKINRIESKHPRLNKLKESVIGNVFYFIYLHWLVFVYILGIALSCFVLLFVAELIFPETVHMFGYGMTKRMFSELQNQKLYHSAAFVLEQNPQFLKESDDGIEFQMELADVYSHIGEYNKAEKILLGLYKMDKEAYIRFNEMDGKKHPELEVIVPMLHISTATALIDLYESMGDYGRQKEFYLKAEKALKKLKSQDMSILYDEMDEDKAEELASIDFDELFDTSLLLRGLKVKYHESPLQAISDLKAKVDSIAPSSRFNTAFKLKHISTLVEWKMRNRQVVGAYPYLYLGADFCFSTKNLYDPALEYSGPLAKTAFEIGDKETGYKLLRLFQHYLERNYSPGDINRLKGQMLLCRYYDSNQDVEKLTNSLIEICHGLKDKITENFIGLSSDQREYLAASLREPFDYAVEMAMKHETQQLAQLCIDNLMFERGLLLRSDASMRNAVKESTDSASYTQLISMQRELAARQHLSGPGNALKIGQLKSKIKELEKSLASIPAYEKVASTTIPTFGQLKKALGPKGYYVELGQLNLSSQCPLLYALVLSPDGKASAIKLTSLDEVTRRMHRSINEIYTDQDLTQKLLGKVLSKIPEGSKVNYSVSGIFSQLSLPAMSLSFERNLYLADKYDLRLISSPASLKDKESQWKLLANNGVISLWGGIDYGNVNRPDSMPASLTRGLQRGEYLNPLPGSLREIKALQVIFSSHGYKPAIHTAQYATKNSFLKEEPNLLHISTHGAFAVSDNENPLSSSFLFFQGANQSWAVKNPTSLNQTGIVSGVDIQGMNLSECELVVLSACETGLGYADTREGVFGLQRAFKLAGANKILMSMWSVSDAVTAEFMAAFYSYLLEDPNHNAAKALRKARTDIRRYHPMPSDWGAFVLLD